MTCRLAFLILAHDHFPELKALVRRLLGDDSSVVVVHIDRHSGDTWPDRLETEFGCDPRFRLCHERIACHWGHHTLVDATFRIVDELEESGIGYDYATLLSAQDWPIGRLSRMQAFLDAQAGPMEYLDLHDMETDRWIKHGFYRRRYQYYWPVRPMRYVDHLVALVNRLARVRRTMPNGWHPWSGSQWWTLTRDALLATRTAYRADHVLRFFRRTFIPDEMVFQTILANTAPFSSRITGNNLRHVEWLALGTPKILDEYDYPTIEATRDCFFARKISLPQSALLVERLS